MLRKNHKTEITSEESSTDSDKLFFSFVLNYVLTFHSKIFNSEMAHLK